MGPAFAAARFRAMIPEGAAVRVTLYGSLAATGRGHMTDRAIIDSFAPRTPEIAWKEGETLPFHPNGMLFEAFPGEAGKAGVETPVKSWTVYSVGGGALAEGPESADAPGLYPAHTLSSILSECASRGIEFWEYVEEIEGPEIWDYLQTAWEAMLASVERGLGKSGLLPGGLGVQRKASLFYRKALFEKDAASRTSFLAAYAHAVAEENAASGVIVTAPTCGSAGVLPAVLKYLRDTVQCDGRVFLQALATAGLIGNVIKHNASISGAEVGCQGEIGSACSMAAAAATHIMGGRIRQIEYAAEIGLEHFLGLTCDPVGGLVQIPCIERNTFGATRALSVADYALLSDGEHRVSFDEVVEVMKETGHDIPSLYRETSKGGLATRRGTGGGTAGGAEGR